MKRKAIGQRATYGQGAKKPKFARRQRQVARVPRFSKSNNLNSVYCKLTRLEHINFERFSNSTTTIHQQVRLQDLRSIPKFNRMASMYTYFKIHKLTLQVSGTTGVKTMISTVDANSDTPHTTTPPMTAQQSYRIHHMTDNVSKLTGRTFDLSGLEKFRGHISCQGPNARLQEDY